MNKETVLTLPVSPKLVTGASILRLPRTMERTGMGRSSVYAGIKQGTFPAPIKLGERAVGWLSTDIDKWLAERVTARKEAA